MSTNSLIPGLGFHHAAVQTADYDGTKRFYTEVLGCRLTSEWGLGERRLCLLDLGDGGCIELISGEAPAEPVQQYPMIHLALRVDNVDAAIERVRAAGMTVTMEPQNADINGHGIRIAFFLGPNGELLEFFQDKM